jgi:hypothetical protein
VFFTLWRSEEHFMGPSMSACRVFYHIATVTLDRIVATDCDIIVAFVIPLVALRGTSVSVVSVITLLQ